MDKSFSERFARVKNFAADVHLAFWIYGIGVAVIGWLEGIAWFWIMTGVPITAAAMILIQMTWFRYLGWWPLPFAATRAFDDLDGTEVLRQVHGWGNTPAARLDVMAGFLRKEAPIWGRRLPSPRLEQIGQTAFAAGAIAAGAKELCMHGNPNPYFSDLSIKRRDYTRAIRALKRY